MLVLEVVQRLESVNSKRWKCSMANSPRRVDLDELKPPEREFLEEAEGFLSSIPLTADARHMLEMGRKLLKVRDILGKSNQSYWLWVEGLGMSRSRAHNLTQSFAKFGRAPAKFSGFPPGAMYHMASLDVPDEVTAGLIANHKAGEPVGKAQVETAYRNWCKKNGVEFQSGPRSPGRKPSKKAGG